jgi:signal transduction histidine kinase
MNISIEAYIITGTFIIMVFVFSFVFFVVYYQRKQFKIQIKQNEEKQEIELQFQKKMLENAIEIQETERRRLAKDLHDEVGAVLSVLKMGNNQLFKENSSSENQKQLINNNKELIEESISLIRNISKDLVPQTLENFGLIHALEEFILKIEKNTTINYSFSYKNIDDSVRLSKKKELSIYRIIQELSNNSLKHSNAEEIKLSLEILDNNRLIICFSDNGIGFDFNQKLKNPSNGLGIRNIESRLSLINGHLTIPKLEKGVKIIIEINDCYGKD